MVPEELKKWVSLIKDITSTSAIILIVLYLVWSNTGDRAQAIAEAKVAAQEAVAVVRVTKDLIEGHTKMTSEEVSVSKMILVQICVNTARGNNDAIQQCINYR